MMILLAITIRTVCTGKIGEALSIIVCKECDSSLSTVQSLVREAGRELEIEE
jgi:hypothetical protein